MKMTGKPERLLSTECVQLPSKKVPHFLILTVKLAAWKAITTLPHALESTHAILSILVQDYSDPSGSLGGFPAQSSLPLRQSYATSIIRLVNGLVDPLQVGAYARSIASIAAQLGLPAWLVELRHAATHEDLPSLEILREAANQVCLRRCHTFYIFSN